MDLSADTPNILVISERNPEYKTGSGDQKILYTTYKNIQNIYFFVITESIQENFLDTIKRKTWRYRNFVNAFSLKNDRFMISEIYFNEIKENIEEIIDKNNIKLIIFEQTGILMWSWCRYFHNKTTCIMRIHDSHLNYFLRDIIMKDTIIEKIKSFGYFITQRIYEKKYIFQWDKILFLSTSEYNYYKKSFPEICKNFIYTPPSLIVKKNIYFEMKEKTNDLLFIGSMGWKPNSEAIAWFMKKVIPKIIDKFPEIRIRIVGKKAKEKIKTTAQNISVIGFVESIEEEYLNSKIFINPTRSGGGIKVKIIEAMSYGLPIITTTQGLSGFNDDIRNYLIAVNNHEEFTGAISYLLTNPIKRMELSRLAFSYAKENFTMAKNQMIWKSLLMDELSLKNH